MKLMRRSCMRSNSGLPLRLPLFVGSGVAEGKFELDGSPETDVLGEADSEDGERLEVNKGVSVFEPVGSVSSEGDGKTSTLATCL